MKLAPRDARAYFARPDPRHAGLLIHGADPVRVAMARQEAVQALLGRGNDLGLTRIEAGSLRRDPASVADALKERSMFSDGLRVVLVEEATDAVAPALAAALKDWAEGDAYLLVTAGQLTAKAKLRKAFEDHPKAMAAVLYDDPPGRAEVETELAREGFAGVPRETLEALVALARAIPPGDFRQCVGKLALYMRGEARPPAPEDVAAIAPLTQDAELDDLVHLVAEARTPEIGPMLRRLAMQGQQPVAVVLAASRHFRALYAASCDPGGAAAGLSRLRPPVFGPRRDRMARQAQGWGAARLEAALSLLTETDLSLRSASNAPPMAVTERALIRLAMMGKR